MRTFLALVAVALLASACTAWNNGGAGGTPLPVTAPPPQHGGSGPPGG